MRNIEVYVDNLKTYVKGIDRGCWINLGMDEKELQQILHDKLGLEREEATTVLKPSKDEMDTILEVPFPPDIAIFSYKSEFTFYGNDNIYNLNQLAVQIKQLSETDYNKLMEYCGAKKLSTSLEMSNVCQQIDKIPYERFPDWAQIIIDPEFKLGLALYEKSNLAPIMKKAGLEKYFDYKKYGKSESFHYDICNYGYINKKDSINLYKYSYEQIQSRLENISLFPEKYKEQNLMDELQYELLDRTMNKVKKDLDLDLEI